ncbi:M1 family metallopeptidase [Lysobacter sp. D1-1-M9]|uniref:M1 family metallopeptidase n=2 Tax=Novilysobacter TaxID=3382699 RepID=UPI002FCAD975
MSSGWRTCSYLLAIAAGFAPFAATADEPVIDVEHYRARVEPDLATRTVRGVVSIAFAGDAKEAVFDAGELEIDSVELKGSPVPFVREGSKLRIALPERLTRRSTLQVRYHGAPRFGLEFHPDRNEIYTIFSASQWLVSVDAPSERATLDLELVLPAALVVAATGRPTSRKPAGDGRIAHRWRLTTPAPSFTYGFAAGRYTEARNATAGTRLRFLSTDLRTDELRQVFANTGDMIRFFEHRAGTEFEGDYTQVLVTRTIGQEAAGLALLSEQYGKTVLADPTAEGLIAHEIAHQWWGVSVTCKDWGHFWLNEGFATFMTAVYLGHRHGASEYVEQVEKWKARWEKLKAAGTDHPLVYSAWSNPSADDRAVVYQKGAYVLHLLRLEMGEDAFWRGIRGYTRANAGRSVDTNDFKAAMTATAGRDLTDFFARWIDGPLDTGPLKPL